MANPAGYAQEGGGGIGWTGRCHAVLPKTAVDNRYFSAAPSPVPPIASLQSDSFPLSPPGMHAVRNVLVGRGPLGYGVVTGLTFGTQIMLGAKKVTRCVLLLGGRAPFSLGPL